MINVSIVGDSELFLSNIRDAIQSRHSDITINGTKYFGIKINRVQGITAKAQQHTVRRERRRKGKPALV